MRSETGKRPQAPSNLPLQPLKKQNDMTFGQPRKLCLSGGVLPRPIVSEPRKEYLSIFSRAIFSTPWYFRERPIFGILGRFDGLCGLVRPHSAFPCCADLGLYGLVMYLSFNSRHPQYSHSNHVSAARPRFSLGSHSIGVQSPHLAQNASGSSDAGIRRTLFCNGAGTGVVFFDTPRRERPVRVTAPMPF